MSAARLLPLASLMIDMMVLGQLLPAHASEANLPPAAAEEAAQNADGATDLKTKPEPAAAVDQRAPTKSAETPRAAAKTVPTHKQPIAANEDAEKSPAEPPASIMKMLEGRERELLAAAAIAAAFFVIGWICGGNYYLRRDRRRRTKLRF
jgi:hypothetical protein